MMSIAREMGRRPLTRPYDAFLAARLEAATQAYFRAVFAGQAPIRLVDLLALGLTGVGVEAGELTFETGGRDGADAG